MAITRMSEPVSITSQTGSHNKDNRILYQGLIQAALQSPALPQYAATLKEYLAIVVSATEQMAEVIKAKG